jgi:hypothetical protein
MLSLRFVLAVLAGGCATSMTDWLFMGDWVYKRFDKHPEIWRCQAESTGIARSAALPFLTCAVFDFLCVRQEPFTHSSTFTLALGAWMGVVLANDYHKCCLDEDNRSNCGVVLNGMAGEILSRRVIVSTDCAMTRGPQVAHPSPSRIGSAARFNFVARHLEICRRRIHHGRAAHPTVGQFHIDDSNSGTDIEDARSFEWPSAEFG